MQQKVVIGVLLAMIAGLAWFTTTQMLWPSRAIDRARAATVKQNLHYIEATIDRYSRDTKKFPDEIEELIKQGYLEHFPDNAYSQTYRDGHNYRRPMKPVKLEDTDALGDFVYIPIYRKGSIVRYYLLGISEDDPRRSKPTDFAWQHVSLCLKNVDPPGASK